MAQTKRMLDQPGGDEMRRDLEEDGVDLLLDVGADADWIRSAKVKERRGKKRGKDDDKNK